MKLELLVATMHQKDFSKIEEMNVQCDAVFANQADRQDYTELTGPTGLSRMVTTDQRGVGRNRNLALIYARGDILLFADDDMVYYDGYAERVCQAFEEYPDADVMVFEIDFEKQGEIYARRSHKTGKLPVWKSWKYGAAVAAVRRASIDKANIWFHTQFGGGCKYSSGEDSLFLIDCYKKGLTVYSYSYCIGKCKKDSSTWFEGYTEKYFVDKGVWLACAMPVLCRLAALLLAVKWRNLGSELTIAEKWKLLNRGIGEYRREVK